MISFDCPQLFEVSAFRMLVVLFAFSSEISMCALNFSDGSKVRPRTLGFLVVGIVWLLICSFRTVLNSCV